MQPSSGYQHVSRITEICSSIHTAITIISHSKLQDKRIQRLIDGMFSPVMVDTLQYCSMKWNKSVNSNIYLSSLHLLSLHISFQIKHNRNVTCNHRNRNYLLHTSSQWLSSNTILYLKTSFCHHHRLMHGMLELNFRLYISATTESSTLQKLHVKRVTSVDIRWQ